MVLGNIREGGWRSARRNYPGQAVVLLAVAVSVAGIIPSLSEGTSSVPALVMVEISEIADSGPLILNGTVAVDVFGTGGSTYLAVAAARDDGIQIINVTDPSNPVGTGSIIDGAGTALDGAYDVDVFGTGGSTYLAVAAVVDDGIQIVNVTDPSNPVGTGSIIDGAGTALDGASAVDAFGTDGGTYLAVASYREGIQIVNVTDPSNPVAVAAIFDDDAALLDNARGVDAFRVGGSTYLAVTSRDDSSLGVVNVTDPARPVLIAGIRDGGPAATLLGGARGVDTFVTGGSTYAVVAAQGESGLQLVDIADPSDPSPVSSVADGPALLLGGAASVTTVNMGSAVYALAVSMFESGVQVVEVTDPSNPVPVQVQGAAAPALNGTARDVAVFRVEGTVYAAVATGFFENSLRILEVVPDDSLAVHTPVLPPVPVSAGYHPHAGALTVVFDGQLGPAVHADRLHVREAGGGEAGLPLSGRSAVEGSVLTVTLNAGLSGAIGAMASPLLDIGGGAVSDMYGNPVRAAAGIPVDVPDTTPPGIVSVTYDNSTGLISLVFSEPLNHTATDHSGLAVLGSSGNITLAAAADRGVVDDDDAITATLGPEQRGMVGASPALRVSGGAVTDVSGNQIEPVTVPVRLTANRPPVVDAGPDLTIREGAIITLNGTASDVDGDALTYRWSHGPPLAVLFDDPASPSTSFTAPQVNATTTISLTLAVSDGNATTSDSLALTISDVPPNRPPTVDAGPDLTIREGAIITLNGTASDVDGDALTYRWSHGPALAVSFDDPASPSTSFTAPQVNATTTISLTLAVSDGKATTSDSLALTISDVPPNRPPTVNAGPDLTIREGAIITLNGTASDVDGDALTYRWSHGPALAVSFDDPASPSTSFTAPQVNTTTTISLTLAVSDGNATTSDSLALTISDVPPNRPPTVDAGPDLTIREGAIITLNGTASDVDGDALTYRWSHGPALAVSFDDPASPSTSFTAPQVNATTTISLTLAVSDGKATTSDSLALTISDVPPNRPPTVNAGPDLTIREGAIITLNGTASDVDGDALTYRWSHGPALAVSFDDPASPSTSFTAPQVNTTTTISLTLAVSDGKATTSDSLALTISDVPPNRPPVVDATASLNGTDTAVDTTPPVLTLNGGAKVQITKGVTYVDPGYTAVDDTDGDITDMVVVDGSVDTDTLGAYVVSYEITDGAGNMATKIRTVTVVPDTVPPTITLSGGSSVTLSLGPTFTDPGYTATDNIDGDIAGRVSVTGAVDPLIPGIYVVSYEVADSSGNTERQTRTVTVSPPTDTASYCDDMTLAQLMASGRYNVINKMFSSESSIAGTGAADLIIAGDNGPTIEGRGGNDCIIGGAGDDQLLGLGGDDMIFGNGGDDTMRGGPGADQMWGQDGADTMYGGKSGDTMHGGAGEDTMHGGAGQDTMYGGPGADQMWGQDGADTMYGGKSGDTMHGGPGADTMHGGAGQDTMYGGPGADQMWGLGGNDVIHGDAGDDTLYGGAGQDTIHGGAGTDTIESNKNDTVHDDDNDDDPGGG